MLNDCVRACVMCKVSDHDHDCDYDCGCGYVRDHDHARGNNHHEGHYEEYS